MSEEVHWEEEKAGIRSVQDPRIFCCGTEKVIKQQSKEMQEEKPKKSKKNEKMLDIQNPHPKFLIVDVFYYLFFNSILCKLKQQFNSA